MKGTAIRVPMLLCLMGMVYLTLTGGSCGDKQVAMDPDPVDTSDTSETTPPPPPPSDPEVDIEMVKKQIQDVFFDYDKYELRSEARAQLQENARLLKEHGFTVVLEGHCDERGTEEYNLALGERRASAVRGYLVDLGASDSNLSTISYGEEKPFSMGSSESAWSQNRRVHFRIE